MSCTRGSDARSVACLGCRLVGIVDQNVRPCLALAPLPSRSRIQIRGNRPGTLGPTPSAILHSQEIRNHSINYASNRNIRESTG